MKVYDGKKWYKFQDDEVTIFFEWKREIYPKFTDRDFAILLRWNSVE